MEGKECDTMASVGRAPSSPSRSLSSEASPVKLPIEILRTVVSYAEPRQLKDLAQVSKEFYDIVCSLLYRHIHYTFTEGDGESGHPPVEYLAAILETLAGGDHDYGKYVKSFLVTADSDSCAEKIAHELRYDYSSGKLLNALLQVALKKASTLESFKWDIRVELGQSFLTALSQKTALRHLHLRLQPGPSLHSNSIMDKFQTTTPSHSPAPNTHLSTNYIPPGNNLFVHPNPPVPYATNHNNQTNKIAIARISRKLRTAKLTDAPKNISLFSHLISLAILEIDNYEYIPEIAECVANSVPFLQNLKLSFSEKLALKSRNKALTDNHDAATTVDDDGDDFNPILPPPPPPPIMMAPDGSMASTIQPTTNLAEVRKQRNIQEKALSEILGLTKVMRDPSIDHMFEMAIVAAYKDVHDAAFNRLATERVAFVETVRKVAGNLMSSKFKKSPRDKRALDSIGRAALAYLHYEEYKRTGTLKEAAREQSNQDTGPSSSKMAGSHDSKLFGYLEKLCEDSSHPPVYPFDWFDEKTALADVEPASLPHDPDVNGPTSSSKSFQNPSILPLLGGNGEPQTTESFSTIKDKDDLSDIVDMEHPDAVDESDEDQQSADEGEGWASKEPLHTDNFKGKMPMRTNEPEPKEERKELLVDYLRARHGISLESLSIFLIPVKASVLFKGVDISNLRHLSLLNVGSQTAFWCMVSKLPDKMRLTSIHTDDVTREFLHVLGGLERVTELFLFERNRKTAKVTPLSLVTDVRIEDLRQNVLRSHLGSLRRLVIRNEHNSQWKFDVKSIFTLANRGIHLKELMIEVNSEGLHRLMQQIHKFRSLSALHILFHTRDSNATMLREMRYNLADTICHCPSVPLEYIGLSNSTSQAGAGHVTQLKWNRSSQSSTPHTPRKDRKVREMHYLSAKEQEYFDEWDADPIDDGNTDDEAEKPSLILKKDMRRSAVQGIRMWERDSWGMKL